MAAKRCKKVYVIVNYQGDYWSNRYGWVNRRSASRFSGTERRRLNLPMGGKWKPTTTCGKKR